MAALVGDLIPLKRRVQSNVCIVADLRSFNLLPPGQGTCLHPVGISASLLCMYVLCC